MSDLTGVKILTLAFHPSTPESEAVVAFLKARRSVPVDSDFSKLFVKSSQYDRQTRIVNEFPYTSSHIFKIPAHRIPIFLDQLDQVKDKLNYDRPFYTIKVLTRSWKPLDRIDLRVTTYFKTTWDMDYYDAMSDAMIDNINKQ